MKEISKEISSLVLELFPDTIYKEGKQRRYNKAYGYELSRELIVTICSYDSIDEINNTVEALKLLYPDSDNNLLTLFSYQLYLEPQVSTDIHEDYPVFKALYEDYLNVYVTKEECK